MAAMLMDNDTVRVIDEEEEFNDDEDGFEYLVSWRWGLYVVYGVTGGMLVILVTKVVPVELLNYSNIWNVTPLKEQIHTLQFLFQCHY